MPPAIPARPRSTLVSLVLLWLAFYASFTLFTPPLLDDADSVHVEVAREMLLRHDYVTLYANGIRYLEKAPLLYWAMAVCMKLAQLLGATGPRALAAAARLPVAFAMLALVLLCEAFARRLFVSALAGLYAALILLSSCGLFLFTRITLPDIAVCLWLTLALYALWLTETRNAHQRLPSYLFALACALNVLTKGLIGVVFPVAIALLYLAASRGLRGALARLRQLHPLSSALFFFLLAAPWHLLAGLANPGHGHPAPFVFLWNPHHLGGHWIVPLPSDGNVRGWFWFYFLNEHLLRYLSLRIPHDYDTAPLWLFWGLCLVWLMPFSAFLFRALLTPLRRWAESALARRRAHQPVFSTSNPEIGGPRLLLILWAALPLLFFSLSSRQEYYVLPSLPALALLLAGWLSLEVQYTASTSPLADRLRRRNGHAILVPLVFGTLLLLASVVFLLHSPAPNPASDLATLLTQNPADYALSLGHFLDLTGPAVTLFRAPLLVAAFSLCLGPLAAVLLRRRNRPHPANLALATGAFGFLVSVQWGLMIFSPVLTSAQLAAAIRPQLRPTDLICIHGEYEAASSLAFYLRRPAGYTALPNDAQFLHILEGRSSNLWYGSFFPDAPKIFETPASLAAKWPGPQRIFLWQSLTDPPSRLPPLPGAVYILVKSGGKEIVSNQPTR